VGIDSRVLLDGQVAIVTGSGRGIGRAIAMGSVAQLVRDGSGLRSRRRSDRAGALAASRQPGLEIVSAAQSRIEEVAQAIAKEHVPGNGDGDRQTWEGRYPTRRW